MSMMSDAATVFRGFRKILNSHVDFHYKECALRWDNSSIKPILSNCREELESTLSKCIHKSNQASNKSTSYVSGRNTPLTSTRRSYCTSATKLNHNKSSSVNKELKKGINTSNVKPLASATEAFKSDISDKSKQSKVPSTRIERIFSFGSLGAGLAYGALSEMTKRGFGMKKGESGAVMDSSPFLTEENAERIVNTLCRVRGAALKLGQMLSIQDNSLISPALQSIFDRVRQNADFMPPSQVEAVLTKELGSEWQKKLLEFNPKPFAAASIGQVHKARLPDQRQVAVKIQYPGVANSINSDVDNLMSLLKVSQVLPEGLYANTALKVAKKELGWECDYLREAEASEKFRSLLKDDMAFYVPEVVWDLTTKEVLVTELVRGVSLDALENEDQELKNEVCEKLLELCLKEVFTFRFMQTDPNWSNFLFDHQTGRISLIDFGASRGFDKKFTDPYIQLIKAASLGDKEKVLKMSKNMKFLTGFESKLMENAHVDAVMILGEAFSSHEPFNFGIQSTARRIHELIPVMLKHRLTPPPEETYSLHRKMAGCFLLCSKLKANIVCKPIFEDIYQRYLNDVVGGDFPEE